MISIQNLSRHFGAKKAVDNISFEVHPGQVMGLLGPNGAGKSTTMKMLTGCLRPTSGQVLLGSHDVWKQPLKAKSQLGFLPESAPSYDDLTVVEFLHYLAAICGLSGKTKRAAVDKAIGLCYLEPVRNQSVDTLSKGYKHRICLAQSIVHDPAYIVFDEPTDGLDPNQKREIQNLILEIKKEKCIILSTHILDEVDAVCSDVVLLHNGQIIRRGTPKQISAESTKRRHLTIRAEGENIENTILAEPKVTSLISQESDSYTFDTTADTEEQRDQLAAAIYHLASDKKWTLKKLTFQPGSLEEVFRTLTFATRN